MVLKVGCFDALSSSRVDTLVKFGCCSCGDSTPGSVRTASTQDHPGTAATYLEQINKDRLQRYFVTRVQRLGLKVTVEPVPEAA